MNRDDQLAAFCQTFVGYGTEDAEVWLIGLEEGGGVSWDEIESRLDQWEEDGRPQFQPFRPDPVPDDHRWFGHRPKLQPYWNRLSRLMMAAEGRPVDIEEVRAYQRTELASPDGGAALLELLPLPSPSTSHWLYGDHSALPWLSTRQKYREFMLQTRTRLLHDLIREHRPAVAVFVGVTFRDSWEQVAGQPVPLAPDAPVQILNDTQSLMIYHPAARGRPHTYFEEAGRSLAYPRSSLDSA